MPIPNGIDQSTQSSCKPDGGIYASYGTHCANITDVTIDSDGIVTAVTTAATGNIRKFSPTQDDSAYYNDVGERTGDKRVQNQEAFVKFEGNTAAKIKTADVTADECCTIWFHFLNGGITKIQGIDVDKVAGTWKLSKQYAKATPTANSDTGANVDFVSMTITSVGRNLSAATTLTEANLAAL